MLINLSNHPSEGWSEKQKEAAKRMFGSVVDIAAPNIPPAATPQEVIDIGQLYYGKIRDLIRDYVDIEEYEYFQEGEGKHTFAVHLMGEVSFVTWLRWLLRTRLDIDTYCSTTERIVLEEKDGKKTTQFEFVQFREY